MRYPEADRIREANYAAIMATNAELRAEVQGLYGVTMSQRQIDELLQLPAREATA